MIPLKNKKALIALGVVAVIVAVMFTIRTINLSKKADSNADEVTPVEDGATTVADEATVADEGTFGVTSNGVEESAGGQSQYQSSLSIQAKEEQQKQREIEKKLAEQEEQKKAKEEAKQKAALEAAMPPEYPAEVVVWGSDGVPDRMEDGNSIKEWHEQCRLDSLNSGWGASLTKKDKRTETLYGIGVDQNPDDAIKTLQLHSFGWLIDSLNDGKLDKNGAIKFTDLNVVGKIPTDDGHVALVCCYDWYSVWGLRDTLMIFEDISGTLKAKDFHAGDIMSAIAYVHNVKAVNYGGRRVVCVEYNTFK